MIKTLAQLFGNSIRTISNWKKENRLIILFFEKYFTKNEMQEFLINQEIRKLELIKDINVNELEIMIKEKLIKDIISHKKKNIELTETNKKLSQELENTLEDIQYLNEESIEHTDNDSIYNIINNIQKDITSIKNDIATLKK